MVSLVRYVSLHTGSFHSNVSLLFVAIAVIAPTVELSQAIVIVQKALKARDIAREARSAVVRECAGCVKTWPGFLNPNF